MSDQTCPGCGFTNRQGARFCQRCGGPLLAAPTTRPVAPAARAPRDAAPPPPAGVPAPGGGARLSPTAGRVEPQPNPAETEAAVPHVSTGAPSQASPTTPLAPGGPDAVPLPPQASAPHAGQAAAPAGPAPVAPASAPASAPPPPFVSPALAGSPPPPLASASHPASDPAATTHLAMADVAPAAGPSPAEVVGRPTTPLNAPDPFAALPAGALLCGGRYEVLTTVNEGPNINRYLAVGCDMRHCDKCGRLHEGLDHGFCAECGSELPAGSQTYLVREACEPGYWEKEGRLAQEGVWHPNLVNVYQVFAEAPYGGAGEREYSITDNDDGWNLSEWPRPVPEETALAWAQQLAGALAALHKKGFKHGKLAGEAFRLSQSQARLTNLILAEKMVKPAGPDWAMDEVQSLARIVCDEMLAGQKLSSAVQAVFDRAQAPSRASRYPSAEALAEDLGKTLESLRRVGSLALVSGRLSHVGMVRDHNEDSVATFELQRTQLSEAQTLSLYVVADGMGGHAAGEVASGLAIQAVLRAITERLGRQWLDGAELGDCGAVLKEAVAEANRAVNDRARKTRTDMGTTCVAALAVGSDLFVANVGDSRCYHIGDGQIRQVSVDHSLVQRLVDAGQITADEARTHPQKNYIYRTIGDKPQVEVDLFTLTFKPGEALVLCSDGLSGMIDDAQIHRAVAEAPNPQAACERLIELANRNGGDDNVTAVVVTASHAKGSR